MDYEVITLKEKTAVGVSVRTSNGDPDMGEKIEGLWIRLFQEGIYEFIPGKINEKALGLYLDYAGDERMEYTAAAACEITKDSEQSEYEVFRIPEGRYARFIVRGDMVKAVAAAWQEIWQMDLPRSFVCDFEEYQDDQMEDTEIHIYVGLKD